MAARKRGGETARAPRARRPKVGPGGSRRPAGGVAVLDAIAGLRGAKVPPAQSVPEPPGNYESLAADLKRPLYKIPEALTSSAPLC
jgi:hypothetical protein